MVRIGGSLESNQIIGIWLHPGKPIDDELVSLPAGQPQAGQGVFQKGRGIFAGDAEALGEVILRRGNALPIEIIVGPALRVRQDSAGLSRHGPAAVIGGIGAGQVTVVVQADSDLHLFFRIEINHGLGIASDVSLLSPAGSEEQQGYEA